MVHILYPPKTIPTIVRPTAIVMPVDYSNSCNQSSFSHSRIHQTHPNQILPTNSLHNASGHPVLTFIMILFSIVCKFLKVPLRIECLALKKSTDLEIDSNFVGLPDLVGISWDSGINLTGSISYEC